MSGTGDPGVPDDDEARMAAVLADLAARSHRPGDPAAPAPTAPAPRPAPAPPAPPGPAAPPEPAAPAGADRPGAHLRLPRPRAGATAVADRPALDPVRSAAGPGPAFRPDVEGLRAVAILLVVLYHAGAGWLPGGFVGVDVFFAISGFLITGQLLREVDATGRLSVARFYGRRVLRLLPAASLVIGVTLVAAWWWLPATRLRGLAADAIAANVYVVNYRLAGLGTDYRTATAAPSPLQHFWSLAVEEQFYLVVPLVLLLTVVVARSRAGFAALLAAVTAASLWWSVHSSADSPAWAYFGAPTRIWELGAGALLALGSPVLAAGAVPRRGVVAAGLRWGGIAAIAVAAVRLDEGTVFPGAAALLPVAGAVAVLAAGLLGDPSGSVLGAGPLRWIGARSYSWYLWHWPVLLVAPFVVGHRLGRIEGLAAAALALGLAAATYAMLERPLRENRDLREHPLRAGGLGLALTAGVVALALLLPHLPPRVSLGTENATAVRLTGEGTARAKAFARQLAAAERTTRLPANVSPPLDRAATDEPRAARDGCLIPFTARRTPRHCERYGDPAARRTVVLFGDSHAAQWFPALQTIARRQHWRLAVFTKVACSAADVQIYLDPRRGGYDECVAWRRASITRIRALDPALVVTTSIADRGDLVGVGGDLDREWAQAWSRSVRALRVGGARVVYLDDTPAPRGDVPECLAVHPRSVQRCTQTREAAAGSDRRTRMAGAAAGAGATVVATVPWFCSPRRCPVVVGDTLVYRDDNHVTIDYVRLVTPLLAERLVAAARGG